VSRARHATAPLLEWLLGGVGVALFFATIALLVVEGLRGPDRPGEVSIHIEEVVAAGHAHIVRYRADNRGTLTLVDVRIVARLFDGDVEIERVEAGIDYLPGRSWRRGGFFLREDPAMHELRVEVMGYQEP
jgi:uncharacterized protein (TIGR02588 family)